MAASSAEPAKVTRTRYRPSNGTEGDGFIGAWCLQCERDRDQDCQILARTFQHDIEAPEYPDEWCRDANGDARCTAFLPEGDPIPTARCERTLDMFGGTP